MDSAVQEVVPPSADRLPPTETSRRSERCLSCSTCLSVCPALLACLSVSLYLPVCPAVTVRLSVCLSAGTAGATGSEDEPGPAVTAVLLVSTGLGLF